MIIAITTTSAVEERTDERVAVERVAVEYVKRVAVAGAVPILAPPVDGGRESNERAARQLVDRIDALVLSGGGDIDPIWYDDCDRPLETARACDARDAFELELARAAHERGLPALGICRGMQVMNVALGGALHQDVGVCGLARARHQQKPPYDVAQHRVDVVAGSALARALQIDSSPKGLRGTIAVNSMHHQAASRVAPPLQVSAVSDDGLIEGIEDPAHRFFLGVQWHPEYLDDNAPLFQALADAAGAGSISSTNFGA